jgi:predicted ribonuclease YlaK
MTISPDIKFYDTSSLLLKSNTLFDNDEYFAISSITLEELENIKTSLSRDADIKYTARKLLHSLDENRGKYDIHIFKENMLLPIKEKDLSISNDMKILATAIDYNNTIKIDEVIFVTNDLSLKVIANLFFGDGMIMSVEEDDDDYKGYLDCSLTDSQME